MSKNLQPKEVEVDFDSSDDTDIEDFGIYNVFTKEKDDDAYKQFVIDNINLEEDFVKSWLDIAKKGEFLQDDQKFCVDWSIIKQWVGGGRQRRLIKFLRDHPLSFHEGKDFVVVETRNKSKTGSGRKKQKVYLTPDGFKEYCMVLNTPKSKKVRRYFIAMEKLVVKFYKRETEFYEKQNEIHENNKRKTYVPKRAIVYGFITPDSKDTIKALCHGNKQLYKHLRRSNVYMIKFGKTTLEKNRASAQSNNVANDIIYLFKIEVEDADYVETVVKRTLKRFAYRAQKEVFLVCSSVLEALVYRAVQTSKKMKHFENNLTENKINYLPLLEKVNKDLNDAKKATKAKK